MWKAFQCVQQHSACHKTDTYSSTLSSTFCVVARCLYNMSVRTGTYIVAIADIDIPIKMHVRYDATRFRRIICTRDYRYIYDISCRHVDVPYGSIYDANRQSDSRGGREFSTLVRAPRDRWVAVRLECECNHVLANIPRVHGQTMIEITTRLTLTFIILVNETDMFMMT
jgi:hypothetical protein